MSRNHHTRLIHDRDEAQLNRQIRNTRNLENALRRGSAEAIEPHIADEQKARRRARLAQQRRHKKPRPENTQS